MLGGWTPALLRAESWVEAPEVMLLDVFPENSTRRTNPPSSVYVGVWWIRGLTTPLIFLLAALPR